MLGRHLDLTADEAATAVLDIAAGKVGPVIAREPGVVIEVKWFDELPHWADELYGYIHEHMVNERPSKYVIAMRHLLGEQEPGE